MSYQMLAGHASYRTTEIYTHGDSVSKRHAVDALDPFLGELPPTPVLPKKEGV